MLYFISHVRDVDFKLFYDSAIALAHQVNPYAASLAANRSGNLNPPFFLPILVPLQSFPLEIVAGVWLLAGFVSIVVSLRLIFKEIGWTGEAISLSLLCAPLIATVAVGQVSSLMLPFMVLAWRAARRNHWNYAAFLFGLLAALKPFLLVVAPFLLLKRRHQPLVIFCASTALPYATGLAVMGWSMHQSWIQSLRVVDWTRSGMNGSLLGFLDRLLHYTYGLQEGFATLLQSPEWITPLWVAGSVILACLTGASVFRSRSADQALLLLFGTALLLSPLGWIYYGILLLPMLLALRGTGLRLGFLGLCYPVFLTNLGQPNPLLSITLNSVYFWSLLLICTTVMHSIYPTITAKLRVAAPAGAE